MAGVDYVSSLRSEIPRDSASVSALLEDVSPLQALVHRFLHRNISFDCLAVGLIVRQCRLHFCER